MKYSEELGKILFQPPPTLIRWGTVLFCSFFFSCLIILSSLKVSENNTLSCSVLTIQKSNTADRHHTMENTTIAYRDGADQKSLYVSQCLVRQGYLSEKLKNAYFTIRRIDNRNTMAIAGYLNSISPARNESHSPTISLTLLLAEKEKEQIENSKQINLTFNNRFYVADRIIAHLMKKR